MMRKISDKAIAQRITTAKDAGVPSQFLRGRLRQKTWLKKLGLYVSVEEDVKFGVIVEQVIICNSNIEKTS